MSYFAEPLSRIAGSSQRKLPEGPSEEGSLEDSEKLLQQQSRQIGSPNADWAFQRRYYDRKINERVGPPISPFPNPYAFGPDAL